jgi:hypothetical protein
MLAIGWPILGTAKTNQEAFRRSNEYHKGGVLALARRVQMRPNDEIQDASTAINWRGGILSFHL